MTKKYRIWIVVTEGPHKTPVETLEFEGRKRAFTEAARLLKGVWTRIRMVEKGELAHMHDYEPRQGDRRPGFEDSIAGGTDLVTPTSVRSDT